ncbi:quinoprotein dehydrogenase-associated SoxYZ-like carrier [Comamonas guangdongensis]|uniref:Quinoprotein dehydrogenase-associated SoxYZ-like carrier n=1 Tax=Comamonas guangdongensis TaxID=510515 RepID=A0ABV3ZYV7_9BURK
MLQRRQLLLLGALGAGAARAADDRTGGDPLGSMQWPSLREQYLANAPVRFTDAVIVRTPAFADDAMNVPLQVDARALANLGGGVQRMLVVVDRNPVREVLAFEPLRALPMLSFRMRLEQASPVRAMVQTRDGLWHVGSVLAQAAGGGCTVPGASRVDGSWRSTLNQVQARIFNNVIDGSRRLRVRVMHPMDTGLVAGIPAFYIERLELRDGEGRLWWRLEPHEPVSENPLITFELPREGPQSFRLQGQDNNGNRIDAEVSA